MSSSCWFEPGCGWQVWDLLRMRGGKTVTIQILLKIGAVGILIALLNQILKHSGREEHAYLLNLAGLIIVLSWVIPYINDLFSEIMDLVNIGG